MFRNIGKFLKNNRKVKICGLILGTTALAYGSHKCYDEYKYQQLFRGHHSMKDTTIEETYLSLSQKKRAKYLENVYYDSHFDITNRFKTISIWKDLLKNKDNVENNKDKRELFFLMPKEIQDEKKPEMIKMVKESQNIFALKDYVLSGKDLLEIMKKAELSLEFKKYLPSSLTNGGHVYTNGKNVDKYPFVNQFCNCCGGGIYFTNSNLVNNFRYCGNILADVDIVDANDVFYKIENDKIKGTTVMLSFADDRKN